MNCPACGSRLEGLCPSCDDTFFILNHSPSVLALVEAQEKLTHELSLPPDESESGKALVVLDAALAALVKEVRG